MLNLRFFRGAAYLFRKSDSRHSVRPFASPVISACLNHFILRMILI